MPKIGLRAAVVAAFLCVAAPAAAQSLADYATGMVDALRNEIARRASVHPRGEGREFYHGEVGTLNNGDDRTSSLGTMTDATAIITVTGFCDSDCGDLDIYITDENGTVVAQDTDTDNTPTVTFRPTASHAYDMRVLMYQCSQDPCYYSVGAFYTLRRDDH